jgi:hypothetical protein
MIAPRRCSIRGPHAVHLFRGHDARRPVRVRPGQGKFDVALTPLSDMESTGAVSERSSSTESHTEPTRSRDKTDKPWLGSMTT